MKKTFHLSVVIGAVLAEMEAAQGQTEDAHRKLISVPEERGSPSRS
jgi:hypothetical protein